MTAGYDVTCEIMERGVLDGQRSIKGIAMKTVKYTKEDKFQCLEDLRESSSELTLIHMGRETCMPYHAFSGIRDEYILHFVTNGHGFYSAGGNTWSLEAGNVFLIYPNQPVVYCADSRDPWSYAWVGFKGSRVEAILKQCGFTKNRRILKLADIAPYVSCFDLLMEHLSLELSDILFRESVLMQILSLLCLQYQTEDRTVKANGDETDSSSYVTRAVEFITTHYMHPITISEIADFLGISKGHLNRVFQSRYGMSVQNFIIDFRMQRAAALLENTTDPVKEIALQTGYTDPLVFSKAFKKCFGVSPKAYRDYEDKIELRRKRETTSGENL